MAAASRPASGVTTTSSRGVLRELVDRRLPNGAGRDWLADRLVRELRHLGEHVGRERHRRCPGRREARREVAAKRIPWGCGAVVAGVLRGAGTALVRRAAAPREREPLALASELHPRRGVPPAASLQADELEDLVDALAGSPRRTREREGGSSPLRSGLKLCVSSTAPTVSVSYAGSGMATRARGRRPRVGATTQDDPGSVVSCRRRLGRGSPVTTPGGLRGAEVADRRDRPEALRHTSDQDRRGRARRWFDRRWVRSCCWRP